MIKNNFNFDDNDSLFTFNDIKELNVEELNMYCSSNPDKKVLIELPNTKGLTIAILKSLHDNIYIRIAGAYDYERMDAQKKIVFKSKKKNKKRKAVSYYLFSVIYTKNETIKILEEIENIEKNMNSKWSDIQKLVYLYTTLKRTIMYDPKFEEKESEEVRSLRGLITKQTVCAGYSLILKELLDRQNIECNWVAGHGHAWNIVKIENRLIPIDLTYENKEFRAGIQDSYAHFGRNVKEFNKKHIPDKEDPYNGYQDKLEEINPSFIDFVSTTVIKEEKFDTISFKCKREKGNNFVLIQIGSKIINNEIYYIYYYDEIEENELKNKPMIFSSKVSVSKHIDNINFKTETKLHDSDISDLLFSNDNINDSLSRESNYLGEFISYRVIPGYVNKLKKEEKDIKLFKTSPKVYPREDNSVFVVEKDTIEPLIINNIAVYKYNIYDFLYENDKPVLRKRIVYSDMDFIYSNKDEIQTKLLSEENITTAIDQYCGYIGYVNEFGDLEHNNKLNNFFSKTNNITINEYENKFDGGNTRR